MPDLRALLAAATPRPWANDQQSSDENWLVEAHCLDDGPCAVIADVTEPANAALIVALVNSADELLAVAEAARGYVAYLPVDPDALTEAKRRGDKLRAALAALNAKEQADA